MEIASPRPTAKYAIFYSFGEGGDGGTTTAFTRPERCVTLHALLAYEMKYSPREAPLPQRISCVPLLSSGDEAVARILSFQRLKLFEEWLILWSPVRVE